MVIHFANGTTLEPFDHPYNTTALNERAVELAMVHGFVLAREHDLYPTPSAEATRTDKIAVTAKTARNG